MSIAIIILIILSKMLEMTELQIIQHLMIFGTQKLSCKTKTTESQGCFCLFFILFSDFCSAYFSADCFGKLIYKLHYTRIFIRRGYVFNVILNFFYQCFAGKFFIFFCKNNCSLNHLPANFVGNKSRLFLFIFYPFLGFLFCVFFR